MKNLSKNAKITQSKATTAGGSTDFQGASLDMSGFEGCLFLFNFAAIAATAVTSVKAQESDNGSSGWTDIDDTEQSVAANHDNKSFYVDVYKPRKRYIRPAVDRGTANATVGPITALQYGGLRKAPVSHGTDVQAGKFVIGK